MPDTPSPNLPSPDSPPFFDYDLPKELIAQEPLPNRVDARLMVINRTEQSIEHFHVRDLPQLLRSGDRLVLNDTRVVPAQLIGQRVDTGGRWQGLFLNEDAERHWRIVCKTRGQLKPGDAITLLDRDSRPVDKLWLLERLDAGQWLAHLDSDRPALEALETLGRVPLPPYIRGGAMADADVKSYQTVFAKRPGAVAAPTAGLHFTPELLGALEQGGVDLTAVTLHVGLGTFRPMASPSPAEHQMHAEWCELSEKAAGQVAATKQAGGRVIAVGTTAVRTLESAAAASGRAQPFTGETDLFITPGYAFRTVDALMTNFHFPQTTLLLLVQALAGSELIRQAYQEAIDQRYRFYSYGDAMLIL